MFSWFFKPAPVTSFAVLFLTVIATAQNQEPALRITPFESGEKHYSRGTPILDLSQQSAANRARTSSEATLLKKRRSLNRNTDGLRISTLGRTRTAAATPSLMSFGTGGGDINEVEPNDLVAQGVSLPVNVFGEVSFDHDADFFAFEALAGQRITIEPFAARLATSQLIADIALFDSSGRLLAADSGDENNDPLIRYVSPVDQVLIVGITDLDDLGGSLFDYILNITRGIDIDEQEPNDRAAQAIGNVPATIFGRINGSSDVDFYSFTASAGQTLIVDVDAEALGSRLDAELNLTDPETGIEFFYNDQYDGDDPRYNIVLPYTGRYVVGIGAFNSNSSGVYRLNLSLVPVAGAPIVSRVARLSKKLIEVSGTGFRAGSAVEVNSVARNTTFIDSHTLRAKAKAKVGSVVTVTNPPDDRRSNPLLAP